LQVDILRVGREFLIDFPQVLFEARRHLMQPVQEAAGPAVRPSSSSRKNAAQTRHDPFEAEWAWRTSFVRRLESEQT
jgi:hypothetical protein